MAQILSQRTVVRDRWHNMCTDLCFWHDNFWLAYTRGSAHDAPDGVVVVHRSADLVRWEQTAVIATRERLSGTFAATEEELRLFCCNSRREEVDGQMRQVLHPAVSVSRNGYDWSSPVPIHERNYWLWRVRVREGVFYCPEKGGELLRSEDGRNWSRVARIPDGTEPAGASAGNLAEIRRLDHRMTAFFNEADLIFRPDGELWCVSRTKLEPNGHALLYRSRPPYTEWESTDLGALIHAPALCQSGDKVYLAGRRDPTAPWIPQRSPAATFNVMTYNIKVDPSGAVFVGEYIDNILLAVDNNRADFIGFQEAYSARGRPQQELLDTEVIQRSRSIGVPRRCWRPLRSSKRTTHAPR